MDFTTASYGIKKIGKGVRITDEAQLSGYGNPMGTATNQIAMSISEKLDNDRVAVMYESPNIVDDTSAVIKYTAIVDGVDMFGEEEESRKVILIHSKQKTQLRKDPDFISADKYGTGVMVSGAIGRIAGCDVVVSKASKEIKKKGTKEFVNKTVKKCSVIRNEEKLCEIKKYVELGYLEFDTLEGKISLSCNDKKKIYKIKKGSKIIASVKKIDKKTTDIIYTHYVIEYDNEENEEIIVLMICTIFILMSDEEI